VTSAVIEHIAPELTARGRASRERIVRAALELMLEHGVAATTIDHVLHRAEASKSQLYHYFGGKPGLIQSVIAAAETNALNAQRPYIDRIDSAESLREWAEQVEALSQTFGPHRGSRAPCDRHRRLAARRPASRQDHAIERTSGGRARQRPRLRGHLPSRTTARPRATPDDPLSIDQIDR
jgi:AcrR family transcriptional regulator